jgi:tRNASer (uridine44-2'-O)-methyltransferase
MCLVCGGRRRTEKNKEEEDEAKRRVESILESVRERGIFKTRKPEGQAGDH